jgi:acetoacetyl-CoA synthetase
MVNEGDLLWTPGEAFARDSNVTAFIDWLRRERGVDCADYPALWAWSVKDVAAFWEALWDYFGITSPTPYRAVLENPVMPGARWFPGAQLNFAEQLLRQARPGEVALHHLSEINPLQHMSWDELARQVRCLATWLREVGVEQGDRVVSYLPNTPQAAVAMLATAAVGAIWSSCSPDFGVKSVLDRFVQIRPKVLFTIDGYRYGGKDFDRRPESGEIAASLPTLETIVCLPYLNPDDPGPAPSPGVRVALWPDVVPDGVDVPGFSFAPTPFEHPLWIVYSSGTTGLPKPIVHGHGGITLEMLKLSHFHFNLKPGGVMFFYSTTGWVMWNIVVGSLLSGAAAVLYDGNPAHPDPDVLWRMAADTGTTFFGASPTYVGMMAKGGIHPREKYDLSSIEGILLGGSPVTPESMVWCYENINPDLWLTSQSGGTDVATGFVGASPTLPVYAGEIQTRMLGADVKAFNDAGEPVVDEVAELVVCQPMPSMPLYFWNDEGDTRYRESYFEVYPGLWRHGDYLKINARGGCYIYGRSDSTLNRFGVRIGTADIYRCVEAVEGVADSLIVCLDLSGGRFFMPLFVRLDPGVELDEAMEQRICARLRSEYSPRHVPDRIYAMERIPYTLTGKKMEVPVRKLLMGVPVAKAANRDAMANPAALDDYIAFARDCPDYTL